MIEKIMKIKTNRKQEVIDLTHTVNSFISQSSIQSGICVLWIQHTTAALTVGEGTEEDLMEVLAKMIPKIRFRHAHDPAHTPAHMIGSILGPSLTVPVMKGTLAMGTWQSIILMELDGPRERSVSLQVIGSH